MRIHAWYNSAARDPHKVSVSECVVFEYLIKRKIILFSLSIKKFVIKIQVKSGLSLEPRHENLQYKMCRERRARYAEAWCSFSTGSPKIRWKNRLRSNKSVAIGGFHQTVRADARADPHCRWILTQLCPFNVRRLQILNYRTLLKQPRKQDNMHVQCQIIFFCQ